MLRFFLALFFSFKITFGCVRVFCICVCVYVCVCAYESFEDSCAHLDAKKKVFGLP